MNTFCPIIKEKCRGNECVMWRDERCLIIAFMEIFVRAPEEENIAVSTGYEYEEIDKVEVPEEIKSATPEELAVKLISFVKEKFPDNKRIWIPNIAS
ncbi:MAG TPA: hypothetical protein ENI51_11390, partial [Candidatus Atribacteria bacterium]|nr:hypothetical protein [Candidatus Atribacteria bacterium]